MAPIAVKIKERNVPFLTQSHFITFDLVNGYIASIEGWLWGHPDVGLRERLDRVKTDPQFKHYMTHTPATAGAQVPPLVRPFLSRLDRMAYDIKESAGNGYICTPVTANVTKALSDANGVTRDALNGLIDTCDLTSENDAAAPTFTIANLPPPNTTYRIDRESLSAAPAPRYWTYRIQIGKPTHGGILLQSNILFSQASVRDAMKASVASCPQLAAGFYVRLSAPAWLTDLMAVE